MSSSSSGRERPLTLAEARRRTPAVEAAAAMRGQLQLALFGAVTEDDVIGMAGKLKQMAQAGDLRAMKLFFELVVGKGQAAPPAQQQQVVIIDGRVLPVLPAAEVVPALPVEPTAALPGTPAKQAVLTARAGNGEQLHHPGDARPDE